MNDELNPDVRRLVDLTRRARTPGAADKRRVAEKLAVPLAAGAALGTATTTAKAVGAKLLAMGATVAVAAAIFTQLPSRSTSSPPAPSASVRAREEPKTQPPPAVAPPASVAAEPSASVAKVAPRPAPAVSRTVTSAHELEEEAALLHQAQAAWRAGQSAQALQLASEHARRFPRSQLASERDVLRVLSLCKLGQTQAAKQVGARLLCFAKGSPWYQSVAESCAAQ